MAPRKELPDDEIRKAYAAGLSQAFLAEYFDVSIGTIRERLGLVRRTSRRASRLCASVSSHGATAGAKK